jgi:alpha-tubulin suppressor-like RCC1 family protein
VALFVGVVALLVSVSPALAQTAAGGAGFSVVLKPDGTVWTFGQNTHGQIGDNSTTTPRKTPYQVAGLIDIVAVAAGANHVLALKSDGNLYAWGHNQYGQLGIGNTTTPQKLPVAVLLTGVVAIAAGQYHSVALTSMGDFYTWGKNDFGQLANGTHGASLFSSTPLYIMAGGAGVGAGLSHTLFVKADGTVHAAGDNFSGQLGNGSTTDSDVPV